MQLDGAQEDQERLLGGQVEIELSLSPKQEFTNRRGGAIADWSAECRGRETKQVRTLRVPRRASGLVLLEQRAVCQPEAEGRCWRDGSRGVT